ncbi:MAG TPA: hypothetical protein VIH56_04215 [Candidatus Acidoferrales bacterium]
MSSRVHMMKTPLIFSPVDFLTLAVPKPATCVILSGVAFGTHAGTSSPNVLFTAAGTIL